MDHFLLLMYTLDYQNCSITPFQNVAMTNLIFYSESVSKYTQWARMGG